MNTFTEQDIRKAVAEATPTTKAALHYLVDLIGQEQKTRKAAVALAARYRKERDSARAATAAIKQHMVDAGMHEPDITDAIAKALGSGPDTHSFDVTAAFVGLGRARNKDEIEKATEQTYTPTALGVAVADAKGLDR